MKFLFSFVLLSMFACGFALAEDQASEREITAAGQVDSKCEQTAEADRSISGKTPQSSRETQVAKTKGAIKG